MCLDPKSSGPLDVDDHDVSGHSVSCFNWRRDARRVEPGKPVLSHSLAKLDR